MPIAEDLLLLLLDDDSGKNLGSVQTPTVLGGTMLRGILRGEDDKVLGLFSRTRWPAHDGLSATQVRARAKEAGKGEWAAEAVRDAVQAATAATTAAVIATTVTAGGGS